MERVSKGHARSSARARRISPGMEPLERRALMAVTASQAYFNGSEIMDVVYPDSSLYIYDASGNAYHLADNVRSASVAVENVGVYDYRSNGFLFHQVQVQDVVFNNGDLYFYDQNGAHFLGDNVLSASISYQNRNDPSSAVQDIVFTNGRLYQYDAAGAHYLGDNVLSASAAYSSGWSPDWNGEYLDVVFNNNTLYEYTPTGPLYLGNNVASASLSDTGEFLGTTYDEEQPQTIVFNTGVTYQYDTTGGHYLGNVTGGPAPTNPPVILSPAYKGVIYDQVGSLTDMTAVQQVRPASGSDNISLTDIRSYSDQSGHNVQGTLTIKDWGGDDISVPFVGIFDAANSTLDIGQVSTSDPVQFGFLFQIKPDGSLFVAHDQGNANGFSLFDNADHLDLADNSARTTSYYVQMAADPTAIP